MSDNQSTPITTREILQEYLQAAIKIEHATIPPYLTALYSIKADAANSNLDSYNIIRAVVVEEMLHLTLAANLLNAVGGTPDLTKPDFVPNYPTYLPTGERDFEVGLRKFSLSTIKETFLKIERPSKPPAGELSLNLNNVSYVKHEHLEEGRKSGRGLLPHFKTKGENGEEIILHFWSIGDFYQAILNGFEYLNQLKEPLFTGDVGKQIGRENYYSSGGAITRVTNIETARTAIELISGQGEGSGGQIRDGEGELSHYYRFDQICKGRYYAVDKDEPEHPTGPEFKVYWDEVYPILENAKVDNNNYPPGSELREEALKFNRFYRDFLQKLNRGLNGDRSVFKTAFADMFKIKEAAMRLMRNPIPNGKNTAAPTFEMNQVSQTYP
jgi:Ferritin-like